MFVQYNRRYIHKMHFNKSYVSEKQHSTKYM